MPAPEPAAPGPPRRSNLPPLVATSLVVAALAVLNIVGHGLGVASWLGPVTAAALLCFARWNRLTWAELGLGGGRRRSGVRWGLGAAAVIAAVYALGVLLPATRSLFLDDRYHFAFSRALLFAFVIIPAGTVLVEEIAFRSVLWGMLARHLSTRWVLVTTSLLFGLWHVLPSLHLATTNQGVADAVGRGGASPGLAVAAGTAVTTVGGVVLGELRRRSGSVLASVGMHWATNALGVLFGTLAWSLAR